MKKIILATLVLTFSFVFAFAQSESFDRPLEKKQADSTKTDQGMVRRAVDLEINVQKPEGYPAKDLPENYTGYRIEIMVTDTLLADTSEVFFRHGNVVMETLEGNQFSYTVGDFPDEVGANNFLDKFIKPNYEEPRVVQYEAGKRTQ